MPRAFASIGVLNPGAELHHLLSDREGLPLDADRGVGHVLGVTINYPLKRNEN